MNSHGVVDFPTTDRRCAKAHLVAEISDSDFTGERLALLCETYMNEMENVFVVTDSFDAIVLGSPAQAACSPHIRILSTGMPHLNRNVATAQLRRAWVIDAYLEEVGHLGSRHDATDEDSWVVLTEFDTWWEPRLLEEYINFLEEHRRDGDITIGGAGSGRLSSMSEERRDWGSTNLRGESTMTGKLAIPYGGMSILPLSDMRFAFGEATGGAVACQNNVLDTCFAEEESSSGFPLSECGRMGKLGIGCEVICGTAQHRKEGAPFDNNHVFMACVADKAARSSRKISALWARSSDQIYFAVNKFIFQYDFVESSPNPKVDMSQRWNHFVGAHHVTTEWLRKVSGARRTSQWPTVFLLGKAKSATSSIFNFITTADGSDICGGQVLDGEPRYYDKELHAFDRPRSKGWPMNVTRYLSHFQPAAQAKFCRRFIDATPNNFHFGGEGGDSASQRMRTTLPPGIRAASIFIISLREPFSFAKSFHAHGCHDGWIKLEDLCGDLALFLNAQKAERWMNNPLFAYKSNLKRWFETFGRSRFLVLQFETLAQNLGSLQEFLGFPRIKLQAQLPSINTGSRFETASSKPLEALDCSTRLHFATKVAPEVAGIPTLALSTQSFGPPPAAQSKIIWEPWQAPLCESLRTYESLLENSGKILLYHLPPKCAGTSLSVSLVSTFCPDGILNDEVHAERVGWESRCQWPCSGRQTRLRAKRCTTSAATTTAARGRRNKLFAAAIHVRYGILMYAPPSGRKFFVGKRRRQFRPTRAFLAEASDCTCAHARSTILSTAAGRSSLRWDEGHVRPHTSPRH